MYFYGFLTFVILLHLIIIFIFTQNPNRKLKKNTNRKSAQNNFLINKQFLPNFQAVQCEYEALT